MQITIKSSNYNGDYRSMISRQNTIKKALLDFNSSNRKNIVETDINGWNQTHLKQKKKNAFFIQKRQQLTRRLHQHQNTDIVDLNALYASIQRSQSGKKQRKDKYTLSTVASNHIIVPLIDRKTKEFQLNQKRQNLKPTAGRAKSFNSGYVLCQLRKQVKQQRYLKQFTSHSTQKSMTICQSDKLLQLNTKQSIDYYNKQYNVLQNKSNRSYRRSTPRIL